jgi:hypothetical protein
LRLQAAPDHSTLRRFARRWLDARRLGQRLAPVLQMLSLPAVNVAVDSTGLDPGGPRSYFMARRRQHRRRKRYVKIRLGVGVDPLVAASAVADWGPCADKGELPPLLRQTHQRVRVRQW